MATNSMAPPLKYRWLSVRITGTKAAAAVVAVSVAVVEAVAAEVVVAVLIAAAAVEAVIMIVAAAVVVVAEDDLVEAAAEAVEAPVVMFRPAMVIGNAAAAITRTFHGATNAIGESKIRQSNPFVLGFIMLFLYSIDARHLRAMMTAVTREVVAAAVDLEEVAAVVVMA